MTTAPTTSPLAGVPKLPQGERIAPPANVSRFDAVPPAGGVSRFERVQCGTCGKTYCGSAVVSFGPTVLGLGEPLQLHRHLYCNHCAQIQVWWQSCNSKGEPTEHQVSEPYYLNDPALIEYMLKQWPQMRGVED